MRVCLGGTFDPLHAGHRALLAAACEDATEILVGITADALAARPDRDVRPWAERSRRVRAALAEMGFDGRVETHRLTDPLGPAASGAYDRIVVSAATSRGAEQVNAARVQAGLEPLDVRVVPLVLAQDLLPMSATRVHVGDIDREGCRRTPVRVAVGSANPVKVEAARQEVAALTQAEVEARGSDVGSGVPEQPTEAETSAGALARARAAQRAWPEADYCIGVEAGLLRGHDGAWYDVQCCVVRDGSGTETTGWGPGFAYPAWVTERALGGERVSEILGPVANDRRIGGTTGAIGFLSDGRLDRTALTRMALLMAFVPRIRRDLYLRHA